MANSDQESSLAGAADFIIIGSGSAGSALAFRLSESGQHDVLVLEFGGSDIGPFIQMPAALSYPMNMKLYDWGFKSVPQKHLGNRVLVTPRGKVIGGSSSINGMVFVRGHACDYDNWQQMGAKGWAYRDVLPYFKRMETWHGGNGKESEWRGTSGPLHVTRGPRKNPLYHAFVEAGKQAGFPLTEDYNGQQQEGFGPMEQTVWKGRRWSTANAYLKPALKRPNCRLRRCFVTRVLFEGKKAVAVEAIENGQKVRFVARRDIIISASSINSPKILLLSGIGPAADLQAMGINVIADRQGVGANLQDHLEIYFQQACLQPITLYSHFNLWGKAMVGAQWLFTKTGMGATNHFESAGFIRSQAGVDYPDIQYHFLPIMVRYDGKAPAEGHGFQMHVGPMRSPSRGTIKLASPDPTIAPLIDFNYMAHEKDWQDFRRCIRVTREIIRQQAFAPYAGKEVQPGDRYQSDDELNDFIREHAESAYHPCGTVRMGQAHDAMSVVDPECRVIGVENLRVVDSSIFPQVTNGNLNAPSIMVGEKASDYILGKTPLPASQLEPWINPNWASSDR